MNDEIIFEAEEISNISNIKHKRIAAYRKNKYVLTALKYVVFKEINDRIEIDYSVGYLIDKNGNITRDLTNALVLELNSVVDINEYIDPDNSKKKKVYDFIQAKPRIQIYKNGLYIEAMILDNAQKWLDDHPLPRKNVSKMKRLNVYAKYNGRCAYCGCEMELKEMQVDHFIAHMGEGGEDTLDNYYPACSVCNRVKSNASISEFKDRIRHCGEIHRKRTKPVMFDSDKIAIKYDLAEKDHEITFYYEKYNPQIEVEKLEVLTKEELE